MNAILIPMLAGLLGTLVMSALMLLPARLGFARVDVVRAVGALYTKNRQGAFVPGLAMHFVAGIVFAYGYYWLLHLSHLPLTALSCLFLGLIHGTIVMLFVAIAVLEHHPVKRYQLRGPMTGIAQILGHAVYGLVVGLVFQTMGA
jgi:hypothetical protein